MRQLYATQSSLVLSSHEDTKGEGSYIIPVVKAGRVETLGTSRPDAALRRCIALSHCKTITLDDVTLSCCTNLEQAPLGCTRTNNICHAGRKLSENLVLSFQEC